MLTQYMLPFVPFTIPEKWFAKTVLVMPAVNERIVTLGEHWDAEHGCTVEHTFEIKTPCCLWQGWNDGKGHGKVRHEGKGQFIHRLSCAWANNFVLTELDVVDHLCRNRPCWNPDHLEHVTVALNTARGLGVHHQFKRQHEYGE